MTAVDCETGEDIINPYIIVSKASSTYGCFINTSSFRECQDLLIHPLDDSITNALGKHPKKIYLINAVVGEYNGPISREAPFAQFIPRTVSILRRERSRTFLGYLEEEVIKQNLPNTFKLLNK